MQVERSGYGSSTKVTLPLIEQQLKAKRDTMGNDYWSYGVEPARKALEALRPHQAQGVSQRVVPVEELFHPSTYESYSV